MLPFPIMNTYGNVVIPPIDAIAKIKTTYNVRAAWYLTYSGDLYHKGYNGAGAGGTSSTAYQTSWHRVMQNVRDFWVTDDGTLLQKTDGTVWYTGTYVRIGGASGNVYQQAGAVDGFMQLALTSSYIILKAMFNGAYGIVAQIQKGPSGSNKELFCIGTNYNGVYNGASQFGVNAVVTSLTSFSTSYNIRDFYLNCATSGNYNLFAVTESNQLIGCGTNGSQYLVHPTGGGTTTQIYNFSENGAMASNVSKLYGGYDAYFYKTTTNTWYYKGYAAQYQLGNGSTTTLYSPTLKSWSITPDADIWTMYISGWTVSGGSLYNWGSNTTYTLGNGTQTAKQTPSLATVLPSGLTISDIIYIKGTSPDDSAWRSGAGSIIYTKAGKVYFTGPVSVVNGSTTVSTYQTLTDLTTTIFDKQIILVDGT